MNTIKENSKSAFNQQAATYDKDIKGQHARSLYPALLEKLSHIPFQSALDLGCGTGEMLKLILQKDPLKELYGIDISEEMLATVYKGNIIKINNGLPILRRDTAQTRLRAVFL